MTLTQMMGLHLLDKPHQAKDWAEQEEQRRVFWMAFALDRHTAFAFKCPMIINDRDVALTYPESRYFLFGRRGTTMGVYTYAGALRISLLHLVV